MKSYSRTERVSELLKEEISFIIGNRLKDPRIGFLTLMKVEVAKDISFARVYVSVYGDDESKTDTMEALDSAKGFIRKELSGRVRMRTIPELVFVRDLSEEHRFRIDKILRDLKG